MFFNKIINLIFFLILQQIQFTFQDESLQKQVLDILIKNTININQESKIQLVNYMQKVIPYLPISEDTKKSINQAFNNFVPKSVDSTVEFSNKFAEKLLKTMSTERLNEAIVGMGIEQPSSIVSTARYLTIHLKDRSKHIAELLTEHSDKLCKSVQDKTIKILEKGMKTPKKVHQE